MEDCQPESTSTDKNVKFVIGYESVKKYTTTTTTTTIAVDYVCK